MGDIFKGLVNIFSGGAGAAVGNVASFIGVVAALTPAAIFLASDKANEVFVSFTYRELAVVGAVIAVNIMIAWATRRGA